MADDSSTRSPLSLKQKKVYAEARARLQRELRAYFDEHGFLEVETPSRVVCPGMEPHLVAFPAGDGKFLATSPELHLKKLLAAGYQRVFELARAFRADETGSRHLSEFTLLEWYRADEGLDELVADLQRMLARLAASVGADPNDILGCNLIDDFEQLTVRDAFIRELDLDLATVAERDDFERELARRGVSHTNDEGWDSLFFRAMLERVEPTLGVSRPTILSGYPASQAALARVDYAGPWPVALRFELYVARTELANAFDELTDADEQERRHRADRLARAQQRREVPPLDLEFLNALRVGHPPAAGIAFGIDRFLALLLGVDDVRDVVLFP